VIQCEVVFTQRSAANARRTTASAVLLSAVLGLALAACANGGAPDAGTRTPIDADTPDIPLIVDIDAGTAGCMPACTGGQLCRSGICIDATVDADTDGVPAAEDCDDTTAGIGRLAERSCASLCGAGVEQCASGVWGACSAPATCECTEGDPPRDVPCGFCGTQQQLCLGGSWMNAGACNGSGECAAGTSEPSGACGRCGTSMRTCGVGCAWAAPVCTGEGDCVAGTIETETEACGCGTRTRTRTCGGACGLGPWSAFGACSGGGVCTPGATRTGSCDACSQEVCSASCTWSGTCSLRPGNACDWRAGMNFRTCSGGMCISSPCWQFCASSCQYNPCQDR